MSITIRYAGKDDARAIACLIRNLSQYEKLQHECDVESEKLAQQLAAKDPTLYCLLSHDGDKPIGFAIFYVSGYSTFQNTWHVYLEDIYVEEEYRNQGVGRQLIQQIASAASRRGVDEIAFSVLHWNESAIAAYKKLGAVETGQKITGDIHWISMSFYKEAIDSLTKA